jgi:hypothetical protein
MNTNIKSNTATMPPPVVCEYEVGGVKYIVSATTKAGARETATAKIRRLIMNEASKIIL